MDQDDRRRVVAALDRAGLPGARIMRMSEALECEQTRARGDDARDRDRSGARVRVLNSPYRFSEAEGGRARPAAFRGEDNPRGAARRASHEPSEIDALERDGVISARVCRATNGRR
jgi:crotonobetainyl-CoA:carnitine CoA-transferase CaiB-like acyl-CoA transferase